MSHPAKKRSVLRRCLRPSLRALAVLVAALAYGCLSAGGTTAPGGVLEPGQQIRAELAGGRAHEYRFTLRAGDYARLSVEQRTIRTALTVFDPDGRQVFAGSMYPIGTPQPAEVIAARSGLYRLRVSASYATAPPGLYDVSLREVAAATDRLRSRVAGLNAVGRAASLVSGETRAGKLKAIRSLNDALSHWRAAGARLEEARTMSAIALLYIDVGERQKALEYAIRALALARASGNEISTGHALHAIGEVYNNFGERKTAIGYYEQALPLFTAAHDRAGEGRTLSDLGVACAGTGEKRNALALFDRASRIFRDLQDRGMLAEVAGNAGVAHDNLGEYQSALENHRFELALLRELGDHSSEAIALNNIGSAYSGLGEYQKALDAYTAALEINRRLDNRWNSGVNLNNIGWVYANLGENRQALRHYRDSLAITRATRDKRRMAATLNNIAGVYAALGEYPKAIEIQTRALPLRRAAGDADGEANSLNNLGSAYRKIGDTQRARDCFDRALAIHRISGNRYMLARALRNLGELARESGQHQAAQVYLEEALSISRAIQDRNGEAAALAGLARVERDRGNTAAVLRRARESLEAFESMRLAVASPNLRASLFASARGARELMIEALMGSRTERSNEEFEASALLASERGRARSLVEMLAESRIAIRQGVDAALVRRELELDRLIAAKADQQIRLLSGRHSSAEASGAEKELDALTAELEQVQSRIRETCPQYAALMQPPPVSLRQIQTEVLDDDTVLLEYFLGQRKSYLWAVSPTSIESFELPPAPEIEAAGRRFYELLTARNRAPEDESLAARAARIDKADAASVAEAAKMSRVLLGPVSSIIRGKRLLIVAEGVLQYLPFAALPDPAAGRSFPGGPPPLIANHEIVTAPSASAIAVLRLNAAGRKPASKALMVLADPVFSAGDPRVARPGFAPRILPAGASGSGHPVGSIAGPAVRTFPRLRFSCAEAEAILRLAPNGLVSEALDFDASRDTVLRAGLEQYRILHFATHSLIDDVRPELSGVVLSLVDRSGRPQNGFLRLYDIYNLRLRADLVVLSACRTALGREIKGEGLIGLTRGFLYAGAPRIVASLWNIDDRTTAEVMKHFYEAMFAGGKRPAAALRDAQVSIWKTGRWAPPYYWAAFTCQGEWR